MRGYVISLDPAQLRDWSALSAIEVTRATGSPYNSYKLISLERRQREPYDLIAGWVKVAYNNPVFHKDTDYKPVFLLDSTNERTLKDLLRRAGVPARGLVYTGGNGWKAEGRDFNVSKTLMVTSFLALWDSKRFSMPGRASFAGMFSNELKAFRGEIGRLGRLRFEAEGSEHADLVMSVCQGCWFAEQFLKPKRKFQIPELASFRVGNSNPWDEPSSSEPFSG